MAIRSVAELVRFVAGYLLVLSTLFVVLPTFGIMLESGWDRLPAGARLALVFLPLTVVLAVRYLIRRRNRRRAIERYLAATR